MICQKTGVNCTYFNCAEFGCAKLPPETPEERRARVLQTHLETARQGGSATISLADLEVIAASVPSATPRKTPKTDAAIDQGEREPSGAYPGSEGMDGVTVQENVEGSVIALSRRLESALCRIVGKPPTLEESIHGPRWRCFHCGHAWLPEEKEHHDDECAYVIACEVVSEAINRADGGKQT